MIKVTKEKDGVYFTLTAKLDREDAFSLIKDLQDWLYNDEQTYQSPSGLKFHNKEHYDAYLQGLSKLTLSKEMQRDIEERFGERWYITKEGKAIPKELKKVKLKKEDE